MVIPSRFFFAILFLYSSLSFAQEALNDSTSTGTLTLKVVGFENNEGFLLIAVSNSRENYESSTKAFRAAKAKISNLESIYSFEDLPFGEYAIKVFHDEDNDDELSSNFLGIPTEDYGFSNNASGSFGPADYDDAKFIFDKNKIVITIDID